MYLIAFMTVSIHGCYIGSKVVMSLLALELGASQFLIGVLASCYAIMPLVLGVFAGRLADTIGMRTPMLVGASLAGTAMLVGFLWQKIALLFAIALLMGGAFVMFNVAVQSLTGALGKPEDRTRNFNILTISYSVSTFVGPMVAGFTIDYASHAWAFFALALLTLAPIALLVFHHGFVQVPIQKAASEEKSAFDLLGNPPLRRVIIMSGLMVAAWELFGFYMPVFGHSIGLSASTIGMIMGTAATATFATRFCLPFFPAPFPAADGAVVLHAGSGRRLRAAAAARRGLRHRRVRLRDRFRDRRRAADLDVDGLRSLTRRPRRRSHRTAPDREQPGAHLHPDDGGIGRGFVRCRTGVLAQRGDADGDQLAG
jgi:MFS family permease